MVIRELEVSWRQVAQNVFLLIAERTALGPPGGALALSLLCFCSCGILLSQFLMSSAAALF